MRPVFNDLLTQIQRSIGYFTSIDREANIGRVIALGNAMRLPGLQKYLSQNLGHPVSEVQSYRGLQGPGVVDAPAFRENLLSFAVCYGLVLQGMGRGKLKTNLLPPEIVTDRMIRDKKPWAVAMVAALLLGLTINFFGHWCAWNSAHPAKFESAIGQAEQTTGRASADDSAYQAEKQKFEEIHKIGQSLVSNVDERMLWLEMLTALGQCLPSDPEGAWPDKIGERNAVHITSMQCEFFPDLSAWYNGGIGELIKKQQEEMARPPAPLPDAAAPAVGPDGEPLPAPDAEGAPAELPPGDAPLPADGAVGPDMGAQPSGADVNATPDTGPTGPGFVVELRGYHFHNEDPDHRMAFYLQETLLENLRSKKVKLIDAEGNTSEVSVKELGIGYPVIVTSPGRYQETTITDSDGNAIPVKRWDFTVQFAWIQTPLSKRLENKRQADQPQQPGFAANEGGQ